MAPESRLVAVLRIRTLIAELSEPEFSAFMSRIWRVVGREQILSLLFNPLLKQQSSSAVNQNADVNINDQSSNRLIEITRIASDIIQHRDTKWNPRTKPKITDIPSTLIGEIASFLELAEYISFSKTNRNVFVGCNSPNRLQKLCLKAIQDYGLVPLRQFPQIKCLEFYLEQISQFTVNNGERFGQCNQLKALVIPGHVGSISGLDVLISDSSRCFSTVRSLSLTLHSPVEPDKLIQLLSKFEDLEDLTLYCCHITAQLSSRALSLVCPKIKGFQSLTLDGSIQPILDAWQSRLEMLKLHFWSPSNYASSTVRELSFHGIDAQQVNSLLNISKSLRQIEWIPFNHIRFDRNPSFNKQDIEYIIKRCILEQELLKVLRVSTSGHFDAVCSGIHHGLYLTKKRKRKLIQITLNVDVREIRNAEEFICNISRIINVIGMSQIMDWMICVDANSGRQCFDWESMKMALKGLMESLKMPVLLLKGTERGFVVGNNIKMKRQSMRL